MPVSAKALLNMAESDTLDFKSMQYRFYGGSDEEKAELLKDIVAFANAWKMSDAFIVIGVSEVNGRKDQVLGVTEVLKDNDIQQFVNSKTTRPVRFHIYCDEIDGKTLNIIQVEQRQDRPIYLKNGFGKLRSPDVFVRIGSSTTVASPDEIIEMGRSGDRERVAQARLDLEWVDGDRIQERLGKHASIHCANFLAQQSSPKADKLDILVRTTNSTDLERRLSFFRGASAEDLLRIAKERASYSGLKFWVKNCGSRNASSITVKIPIPRLDGLRVIDYCELPNRPRGPLHLPDYTASLLDTQVTSGSTHWDIEAHVKTIRPQDEFWTNDCAYFSSNTDQTIETTAKIFADDLANPIEIPLKLTIQIAERNLTRADFGIEE